MKNKRLNVIARYNEDISWTNHLEKFLGDIVIYNKGEHVESIHTVKQVPNFGREAETWVRAIIDNYDSLSDYDYITFVQGNPFDRAQIDIYPNFWSLYTYHYDLPHGPLTFQNTKVDFFKKEHFINNTHKYIIDLFFERIIQLFNADFENITIHYGTRNIKNKFDTNIHRLSFKNDIINCQKDHEWILFICHLLNIDIADKEWWYVYGAQYYVKVDLIQRKSLNWWKNLYNLIDYLDNILELDIAAFVLEPIWTLIWEHSDMDEKG